MSAKKKAPATPEPASRPSAVVRVALQAAAEARNLAERAEVVRIAIELAKLHNHGNPTVELAASAYLLRAAGDALSSEEWMRKERERMQGEEMEEDASEAIWKGAEAEFQLVPFTEIVNENRAESAQVCEELDRGWLRTWARSLLNENFAPLINDDDEVMLPDVLAARRATFDADAKEWPYMRTKGFRKFLRGWIADNAGNELQEPLDAEQKNKPLDDYFAQAKAGNVPRSLWNAWRFWRAKRSAMEKWGGTTRLEFCELLKQWVPTLPRNAGQILKPQELEKQVRRHCQQAFDGTAPPDMIEKWKAFRASRAKTKGQSGK